MHTIRRFQGRPLAGRIDRIKIVYSPLNGTGLKPVCGVLERNRFTNISVVEEQREPDGYFPTCPVPNPEGGGHGAGHT